MIKGFLLAFDLFLIGMFLGLTIYSIKIKEKGIGILMSTITAIISLNSLFILNS